MESNKTTTATQSVTLPNGIAVRLPITDGTPPEYVICENRLFYFEGLGMSGEAVPLTYVEKPCFLALTVGCNLE
jgi:hypothetical protein